jgi:glucokinase
MTSPDAALGLPAIGLDIGGTKIAGGLVDRSGRVLAHVKRDTPAQSPPAIAHESAALVRELAAVAPGGAVAGVGVACAGFIDRSGSTVLFAPNLAWRDEPLKKRLEALLDLPVVIENDANAAAWGEFRFGAARDVDDMVLVSVGTGVGGGAVVDSRLLRGAFGIGGELGHMRVVPDGRRCGCGNKGCWEQYASGSALVREARELVAAHSPHAAAMAELCGDDPAALSGVHVTEAARRGDPAALELLADLGVWLGEGIASVGAILDPALFVVGGGVAEAGELLLAPTREAFSRNLIGRGHRPAPELQLAQLGNDAGMIGVADLALAAGAR